MAAAAAIVAGLVVRSRSVRSSSNSFCVSGYLFRSNSPFDYVQLLYLSTQIQQPSSTTTTTATLFTQDYFISKYHFSPEIASKIVSASARSRNPKNADLVLSFLKQVGFSHTHLERMVKHHTQLLSTSPEKSVKPKLKIFHDFGFSAADVSKLIGRDLTILFYQPKRIIRSLDVYTRLLGSNDLVVELINKRGQLLYVDPEKTILPNIQFLNQCGVQMDQINTLICTIPYFFMISPQNMRRCVHKVDEMGVDRTSKMFIYAARAVSEMSDETLKLKLKSLQDLGFSQDDILKLFSSYPMVVAVSTGKMKEMIEVLLETGKYDMPCIIENPRSFTCSVEKRFKPRLHVLKALEEKGLISKWPSLSTLCTLTDQGFFERFVAPCINEVGNDFVTKSSLGGKQETATGLKTI